MNWLFDDKKKIAQELAFDEQKRLNLWQEHLRSHVKREQLCKFFNYKNIANALNDWSQLEKVLNQISDLISEDFVHINDELKTEKEITDHLEYFNSYSHKHELEDLNSSLVYDRITQKFVITIFQKIFAVLQLELHTIRLIKERQSDAKKLLLHLFELIYFREDTLLKTFSEKNYGSEHLPRHKEIMKFVRLVLIEEKLEDEILSDEEIFVREMVKKMAFTEPVESPNRYRKLAEDIYYALLDKIGAPLEYGDVAIELFENAVKDDQVMYKIVKRKRPKYTDDKIKQIIEAFRRSFSLGHFEEMESELVT